MRPTLYPDRRTETGPRGQARLLSGAACGALAAGIAALSLLGGCGGQERPAAHVAVVEAPIVTVRTLSTRRTLAPHPKPAAPAPAELPRRRRRPRRRRPTPQPVTGPAAPAETAPAAPAPEPAPAPKPESPPDTPPPPDQAGGQ